MDRNMKYAIVEQNKTMYRKTTQRRLYLAIFKEHEQMGSIMKKQQEVERTKKN